MRRKNKKNHRSYRNNKRHDPSRWLYALGFIIALLIIGSIILYFDAKEGQEPLPSPAFEDDFGAICGNGLIEPGENCQNCFFDVRCGEDETCTGGACIKEKGSLLPLTFTLIILCLLTITFLSYRLIQRHQNERGGDLRRLGPLVNYIKGSLRSGYKEPSVKINLIKAGWTHRDIEKALKIAQRQLR